MEKEIIKTGCRIYDRVVRRDGVDDEGLGSIVLGHIICLIRVEPDWRALS